MKWPHCCSPENQLVLVERWQGEGGLKEALTLRK